jgi:hypothetical protein
VHSHGDQEVVILPNGLYPPSERNLCSCFPATLTKVEQPCVPSTGKGRDSVSKSPPPSSGHTGPLLSKPRCPNYSFEWLVALGDCLLARYGAPSLQAWHVTSMTSHGKCSFHTWTPMWEGFRNSCVRVEGGKGEGGPLRGWAQ